MSYTFAETIVTSESSGLIPEGDVTVIISDLKPINTKSGHEALICETMMMDDNLKGMVISECLNINHPNLKTKSIADEKLKSIARALGVHELKTSDQIIDKKMKAEIIIAPYSKTDDKLVNKIKKYKPLDEGGMKITVGDSDVPF